MHLTLDAYLLALRGLIPADTLLEAGHRHLLECCPVCANEEEAYREACESPGLSLAEPSLPPRRPRPLPEDDRHIGQADLDARLAAWETVMRNRDRARRHLRVLLQEEPERWAECIQQSRTRYRSRAFAELLLEESRARVREDPVLARQLAATVPTVLESTPGAAEASWSGGLLRRAAAWEANALRVTGDLPAADRIFRNLGRESRKGATDPWVSAEIASLEASLRIDERRFKEAEGLLHPAERVFESLGDRESACRVLLKKGALLETQGRPEQALRVFEQAAAHLRGCEVSDYLRYSALNGRVVSLCALDRHEEAERLMEEEAPRFVAAGDSHVAAHLDQLYARIALASGETDQAIKRLQQAQRTFLALDRALDAALVSLDLAQLYLEAGRLDQLRDLAADLVVQFQARGVARETLAALRLLAQAAAAREVSRELLRQLRERVRPGRACVSGDSS